MQSDKKKTGSWQHAVRLALSMLLVMCFLMPMFTISAWKNVTLKNGLKGNGITMLSAAQTIDMQLSSIVRKAKLEEGLTSPVADAGARLRVTGFATLVGLLASAVMFLMCFAETLGVNFARKRKMLFPILAAVVVVLMVLGMWNFTSFAQTIRDAAAVTDEAFAKITNKLYQGDAVPEMKISV